MRMKLTAALFAALLGVGILGSALASQPPGQLGNEGQPGNQGGASGQVGHHP